jgi:cardiolipin synthase
MLITQLKFVLYAIYLIIVIGTILTIVYDKREPMKALIWITVVAVIPVVGILSYILLGRNHRREKIFSRKGLSDLQQIQKANIQSQLALVSSDSLLQRKEIAENLDIITLLLNSNKALLTIRNRIKILEDGEETFDHILDVLSRAESSIHLEYYIISDDRIGQSVAEVLEAKARAGVEVRLIYDDVGCWGLSRVYLQRLKDAGVQIRCFLPVVFPWLSSKVNYRNHRKIIVVDGKIAFTGGVNIAQRYISGTKWGRWRDTHLMLEGDAVTSLQVIFLTDWYFVSGQRLADQKKYFCESDIKNQALVQIATSGPDSDWASILQAFFAAITRAQKHIYISTPYFIPPESLLTAIKVASLSGIDVRIILPARSDSKLALWATRSYISDLLDAKVKVYLYQGGFNHSKVLMIDGQFCSVGTANMDIRSFEDNFEVSAIMYNNELTETLEQTFFDDLTHCKQVDSKSWNNRPMIKSIGESFARLLSPLL